MSGARHGLAVWSDSDILTLLWRFHAMNHSAARIAVSFGVSRSSVLGLAYRVRKAVGLVDIDSIGDGALLSMLDAVRGSGRPAAEVGRKLGIDRLAVLGLCHCLIQEARAEPCEATKPESRDGGMPRLWWTDGIYAREAA